MSETGEDQNDKPFEATRRKLEEARRKGEIVRSQDVVSLGALSVFMIAIMVIFSGYMTEVTQDIVRFLDRSASDRSPLNGAETRGTVQGWLVPLALALFVLPFSTVLGGLVATKQVVFTGDRLLPKLNRISVIANARKKFGWSGLFEFMKNFVKFVVFAGLMTMFVLDGFDLFETAILGDAQRALSNIHYVALRWFWFTLASYVFFAAADALWQMQEHARKNRMSHQEMKDELKTEEGDENIRQQRRAKAEEIATNRMLLDVPKAVVVITNPTHYAVALQWDGGTETVPKCVARGTDETARKIREIAIQTGVPLYRDPATARDLYANVKVGMAIESSHYKAVAAAIGYARRIQKLVNNGRR